MIEGRQGSSLIQRRMALDREVLIARWATYPFLAMAVLGVGQVFLDPSRLLSWILLVVFVVASIRGIGTLRAARDHLAAFRLEHGAGSGKQTPIGE